MASKSKNTDTSKTAAAARGDYIKALRVELEGYKRSGNDARVKDVQAELQRVGARSPRGTSTTPPSNTADTTPTTKR